jgi:DNA uptake protein ComE-like DNA-binding protein
LIDLNMWLRLGTSTETALSIFLGVMGVLCLGTGGYFTYQTTWQHPKYRYIPADDNWRSYLDTLVSRAKAEAQPQHSPGPESFLVEVSGAVAKPGVYEVSSEGRLQDALLMAGGFQASADKQFIHQELNLASRIFDQQKIYVPQVGESWNVGKIGLETAKRTESNSSAVSVFSSEGKLKINQARESDLLDLEEIGEKRAESILAGQPYTSEADFLERSGLPRTLAQRLIDESISIE